MPTAPAVRVRRRVWLWAVVVAVVSGGAAAAGWALMGGATSTAPALEAGPTAVVTRGPLIVSVTETGEVRAEKRKVIANETRSPAIIKWVVEEGVRVNKGDRIIVFECKELMDEIESKKLAVTNARNAYSQSEESLRLQEKEVANDVRKAEQGVTNAEADLRRYIEAAGPMKLADANTDISTVKRDLALAEEKLNFKLKVNADKELNSPFSENEIEAEKLSVEKLKLSVQKAVANYGMLQKYDHPREIEKLQTAVNDAQLALERARLTAKSKMLTSGTDRDTKKVALDLQAKQLDEMLQDANKLTIAAEEEGLVVYDTGGGRWSPEQVRVEVGAKISPRQQLMIIPDMSTLLVTTKVYEAIIDQVRPDLRAHVRFDSRPDVTVPARVSKVGVLPDSQHGWLNPGVKVFKVDVLLDERVADLRPGMTAQVEIELRKLQGVLSLPVAAVFTEQERTFCWLLADGQLQQAPVKIGHMNDTRVEILSGLGEGDRVLLSPPPSAAGGQEGAPGASGGDKEPGAKEASPGEAERSPAGAKETERPRGGPAEGGGSRSSRGDRPGRTGGGPPKGANP